MNQSILDAIDALTTTVFMRGRLFSTIASPAVHEAEQSLIAAIQAELVKHGGAGWQTIESAPKDGTPIIGFWEAGEDEEPGPWQYSVTLYAHGCWHSVDDMGGSYAKPTHWHPLPQPPKG